MATHIEQCSVCRVDPRNIDWSLSNVAISQVVDCSEGSVRRHKKWAKVNGFDLAQGASSFDTEGAPDWVGSTGVPRRAWQLPDGSWRQSFQHAGESEDMSVPAWPVVDRPAPLPATRAVAPSLTHVWNTAVVGADPQIGFRKIGDGSLDPFHDDDALSLFNELVGIENPQKVILAGDILDLPEQGRWAQEAGFAGNTQAALDRCYEWLHNMRSRTAGEIHMIEGNHDKRLQNFVETNALSAFGLRRSGWPEEWPVMSLPYLLRLEELDVTYYDAYPNAHVWINNNLRAEHGTKANSRGSTAQKYLDETPHVSRIIGHCFDEDTELLTDSGWKRYGQLSPEDRAMTYNLGSGNLEYNQIEEFFEYDDYTELHRIKSRDVDLLVTGGHGLVDFEPRKPMLFRAEDFSSRARRKFAVAGVENRPGVNLSEDQLRLIVNIAADGSLEGGEGRRVRFHLKKQRKIDRLVLLLESLGMTYSLHKSLTGTTKVYVNLIPHEWVRRYFPDGVKVLPPSLALASRDQAEMILDEYSLTDGSRYGASVQISTSKRVEADLLQRLFATSGMRCSLVEREGAGRGYVLTVHSSRDSSTLTPVHHSVVPYSGRVWCVSVKNGTLMVRRNGKVCITQNSHRQEVVQRTTWDRLGRIMSQVINPGALCRVDGAVPGVHSSIGIKGNPAVEYEDWQQGAAIIRYTDDKFFSELVQFDQGMTVYHGKELRVT